MQCTKCKTELMKNSIECPLCGNKVSSKLIKIAIFNAIIIMLRTLIYFFVAVWVFFLKLPSTIWNFCFIVNRKLDFQSIIYIIFIGGLVFIVLGIKEFEINKKEDITSKIGKAVKSFLLVTLGAGLIAFPFINNEVMNTMPEFNLVDYSEVKYVVVDEESIPALPLVAGKKKIISSNYERKVYIESEEEKFDILVIEYDSITDSEKKKYERALKQEHYELEIIELNGKKFEAYIFCNWSSNIFVIIDDNKITYYAGNLDKYGKIY